MRSVMGAKSGVGRSEEGLKRLWRGSVGLEVVRVLLVLMDVGIEVRM